MSMHVDDYNILDTSFIIHALPLDPCEHEQDGEDYLIGVLLGVGKKGVHITLPYPTRPLRDAAFEEIAALVKAQQALEEDREL